MHRIVVKRGPTGLEVWLHRRPNGGRRVATYVTLAEALAFADGIAVGSCRGVSIGIDDEVLE